MTEYGFGIFTCFFDVSAGERRTGDVEAKDLCGGSFAEVGIMDYCEAIINR